MINYNEVSYNKFEVTSNKVLIEKMTNNDLKKVGGIFIPEDKDHKNMKLGLGKIILIGKTAKTKYFANEGDFVLYDYYSSFGDWKDSVLINAENLIVKLTEEEAYKFLNERL